MMHNGIRAILSSTKYMYNAVVIYSTLNQLYKEYNQCILQGKETLCSPMTRHTEMEQWRYSRIPENIIIPYIWNWTVLVIYTGPIRVLQFKKNTSSLIFRLLYLLEDLVVPRNRISLFSQRLNLTWSWLKAMVYWKYGHSSNPTKRRRNIYI